MSKADEMRAKQERLKAAAAAATAGTGHTETPAPPAPRTAPPVRVQPVRLTVDLSPARYRDLQQWLNEAAIRLGRSRVTKQDALGALVALLLRDERTAQMVLKEIRESQ
jgi:hypothetical protein